MKPLLALLLLIAPLQAKVDITTVAGWSTALLNGDKVIQSARHPKKTGSTVSGKLKDIFTRGKLKTLPLPKGTDGPVQHQ